MSSILEEDEDIGERREMTQVRSPSDELSPALNVTDLEDDTLKWFSSAREKTAEVYRRRKLRKQLLGKVIIFSHEAQHGIKCV